MNNASTTRRQFFALAAVALGVPVALVHATIVMRSTRRSELKCSYDVEGRLLSIQDRSGKVITYTYDALGRLVSMRRRGKAGEVYVIE